MHTGLYGGGATAFFSGWVCGTILRSFLIRN